MQQFPPQYGGGVGGYGMQNPQSLQMILAYLLAQQQQGNQEQPAQPMGEPVNPYLAQPNRPTLPGLSPLGRFNDMALRQSANLATRLSEGKQAVAESNERQRLVDAITHPPPAAPYDLVRSTGPGQQPAILSSRYGTGNVTFAPLGTEVHGRFGPEGLPFGQIGGPHEAQPLPGEDPLQTTFQQQMIMDSIHKALGRKK